MRSDAKANRREILEAAARLIAEQGLGVSLRTIAQAAGLGIGTLYRHFATREDLLISLGESILDSISAAADEFHQSEDAVDTRWLNYIDNLVNLNIGALAGSLRDEVGIHERKRFLGYRSRTMDSVETVLRVARDRDLIAKDVTVPRFLIGMIQFTRPLPDDAPKEIRDETGWLLNVYLGGLRSPLRPTTDALEKRVLPATQQKK